jgi:hypothetical protein
MKSREPALEVAPQITPRCKNFPLSCFEFVSGFEFLISHFSIRVHSRFNPSVLTIPTANEHESTRIDCPLGVGVGIGIGIE